MIELTIGTVSAIILLFLLNFEVYKQRPNFKGKLVSMAGISLVVVLSAYLLINAWVREEGLILSAAALSIFAGLAGWYDDTKNDPDKGFRGHFSALLDGRITSGLVKLTVVTLIAAVYAWFISSNTLDMFANFLLIASCTNLLNLLDLRPGRSLKFAGLIFLCLLLSTGDFLHAGILLLIFVFLVFDLKERVMLGDAGSNYIGFLAGIFLVLSIQSLAVRLVLAAAFTFLNFLSEKYSFSQIIERSRLLRFFDMLGRGANS